MPGSTFTRTPTSVRPGNRPLGGSVTRLRQNCDVRRLRRELSDIGVDL